MTPADRRANAALRATFDRLLAAAITDRAYAVRLLREIVADVARLQERVRDLEKLNEAHAIVLAGQTAPPPGYVDAVEVQLTARGEQ